MEFVPFLGVKEITLHIASHHISGGRVPQFMAQNELWKATAASFVSILRLTVPLEAFRCEGKRGSPTGPSHRFLEHCAARMPNHS